MILLVIIVIVRRVIHFIRHSSGDIRIGVFFFLVNGFLSMEPQHHLVIFPDQAYSLQVGPCNQIYFTALSHILGG